MTNIRFIINLLGKLILMESFFFLPCVAISLCYGERDWWAFVLCAGITFCAGMLMVKLAKQKDAILSKRDGYFTVSSIWILLSLFGALPYVLVGTFDNFTDAFFETISGFTTTGATVINDIEVNSHAILFWRSLTQWLGGAGIVVLLVAILPSLGIEGRDLYVAETTGPTHGKFTSTFSSSARAFWVLYVALTLIECVLLYLEGMSWYDALCHSLTTLSSGGFSTKQDSIAYWGDSPAIQYTIIVFMTIAGTNLALVYGLMKGKFKQGWKDEEFRTYITVLLSVSVIIAALLYFSNSYGLEQNFRDALFQVSSLITSTGFCTVDYLLWTPLIQMLLLFIMLPCGSAGSTSGGMKIVRFVLLVKNAFNEMKRTIHPNAVITIKYNNHSVHPKILSGVMGYFVLYMMLFTVSTIVMLCFTEDIFTSTSSVITALSNVGPGFGTIGPMDNFAFMSDGAKIFLSILMVIGRLELYTVLVLFTQNFWKK